MTGENLTSLKAPKLRFREFQGSWIDQKGKDLFENRRTKGKTDLPIYSVTLRNGLVPRDSLERTMREDAEITTNLYAKTGDLAYNMMRMWQGAVGVATEDCIVSPAYIVLAPKPNIDSIYFNYLLSKPKSIYNLWAYSYGLTDDRLRLYYQDFGRIHFYIPSVPEQQKIASFFSIIDEKVEKLKTKKSLLEQYKKGVIQKIFLKEIRFCNENKEEYGEWKKFTLSEIGDTYGGLSGKTKEDFGEGENYITYKQIFADSCIKIEKCEKVKINNGEKQNKAKYGDSFFTVSSETPDEIGFSSVLLDEIEGLYLNSFCFGFRPFSLEVLTPEFACFLFRSPLFRRDIVQLAQGSTRYNMSKIQFLKMKTFIPEKKEQQKIASFLSEIDKKIEAINTEIKSTEKWKKGLLQGMFI